MREMPVSSQFTRKPMKLVHTIDSWQDQSEVVSSIRPLCRTDEFPDIIPAHKCILCIRCANNSPIFLIAFSQKIWAFCRPLVAWYIDQPERQRLFLVGHIRMRDRDAESLMGNLRQLQ